MAIDYNKLAEQAGALSSTSPVGNTIDYTQLANEAGAIPSTPTAQPVEKKPFSLKDTLFGAGKAVGDFFTSSEQGLGKNIADIVTAPQAQKQASDAVSQDSEYLMTLVNLKRKAIASGNTEAANHYDSMIQSHTPTQYQAPELPKTSEVALNLAGTAADILTAGTYGASKTVAMKTGELAIKSAPTAVTLAEKGIQAGVGAIKSTGTTLAENQAKKEAAKVLEIVAPKLTQVRGAKVLATGTGKAPGLLTKATVDYSKNPLVTKAAESVKGIVKPGKSFIENTNNVYKSIGDLSENTVKPFLTENKVPFNFQDLRDSFKLITPKSSLKANGEAYKTYNRVREVLLDDIYKELKKSPNPGALTDFNELWDARKVIDSKIQEELGGKVFGTPQYAGVKAAARDFRNGLNKFITDSLANPGDVQKVNQFTDFLKTARSRGIDISNGTDAFKALEAQFGINQSEINLAKAAIFRDALDTMTSRYEAIGNMAPKAFQELGKTKYQLWIKNNPLLAKALGFAAGGAAAGLGFNTVGSFGGASD